MQILTAQQSIDARKALGLSQRQTAIDARMARNMLSLFEQQRALPADTFLEKLRDFYVAQGVAITDEEGEPQLVPGEPMDDPERYPDVVFLDGFVIPRGVPEAEAEQVLQQIADNDEQIATLLAKPVKFAKLFGNAKFVNEPPSEESKSDQRSLLALMARNYCLVRSLQGRSDIQPCTAAVGEFEEGGDTGDQRGWLRQFFADVFGFLDPAEDPDAPSKRTDVNWAGLGRKRDRDAPLSTLDEQA